MEKAVYQRAAPTLTDNLRAENDVTELARDALGQPVSREPHLAWNRFVAMFNLTGLPAISLPCGFDRDGLPIGLQLAGRPFDEATVLRAAFAYERGTTWHERRPPGFE